jgi:hypothetical protein
MVSLGFIRAKSGMSLFILRHDDDTIYLLYIDDIVLMTSSVVLPQRTINALQREITMKHLGPLHHFLGVTVERHTNGLFLHQR